MNSARTIQHRTSTGPRPLLNPLSILYILSRFLPFVHLSIVPVLKLLVLNS
jgi:hypothetical protein